MPLVKSEGNYGFVRHPEKGAMAGIENRLKVEMGLQEISKEDWDLILSTDFGKALEADGLVMLQEDADQRAKDAEKERKAKQQALIAENKEKQAAELARRQGKPSKKKVSKKSPAKKRKGL